MTTIEYAIKTTNLTKTFGKKVAVSKLNLSIPYGKTYGLLGPNGAGKTTTVRMLNAIISSSSGEAYVNGYDVRSNNKNVKMTCGFLPESPGLYSKLTAKEFLEFIGELYYIPKNVIKSRVEDLLKVFDLDERENDLLEGYSRGMKQKICLCAALIQDPKIIFLDEPTSNLDPASAKIVKDMIKELAKKADKTIFICTHMLDTAEELCDAIGIIDKGELRVQGTPQEIIKSTETEDLEQAYLKLMGVTKMDDLLSWRNETSNGTKAIKNKKKKHKK